jgi:hypothetical protein
VRHVLVLEPLSAQMPARPVEPDVPIRPVKARGAKK